MPVISIGNLSMGGRGKTPVAGLVARLLLEAGERPAILTRGYKRRQPEDGVVVVSDGSHLLADVDRAGDEPLMLAKDVPGAAVLVSETRTIAEALASRALGATVCVLDDGFQHRALARETDIVLIAPSDLTDRRLPFGRLRESPRALARAHAVVVDAGFGEVSGGLDTVRAELSRVAGWDSSKPVFSLHRRLGAPQPIGTSPEWPGSAGPVVAVAGIAHPDRFSDALRSHWSVSESLQFSDHHVYSRSDLARIADAVRRHHAIGALTTSKDAVRLAQWRPLPVPMAAVPLEVRVEPAADFQTWVLGRVRGARA